jgi:hypothetical protein
MSGSRREPAQSIETEVRNYFTTKHNFQYVKPIGDGNHGGTGLFNEIEPQTGSVKRPLVVKFSLEAGEADDQLRNELYWLPRLDFEHIVKTIALSDLAQKESDGLREEYLKADGTDIDETESVDEMVRWFARLTVDDPEPAPDIALPERPIMVLEYLPYGNLAEIRQRFADVNKPVPNRLLWRVALCCTSLLLELPSSNQLTCKLVADVHF